jgi:hypothetical protein
MRSCVVQATDVLVRELFEVASDPALACLSPPPDGAQPPASQLVCLLQSSRGLEGCASLKK